MSEVVPSEAHEWLARHGFDDPLYYYNTDGEGIFDLLLRDELQEDNPIFVEISVYDSDKMVSMSYETVGYQFEDESMIAEMGDRWTAFDMRGYSEDGRFVEVR